MSTALRRLGSAVALCLAAAACGACADDVMDADANDLVATWDLVSVDGIELPLADSAFDCRYTLEAASFTFKANGTYTSTNETIIECDGEEDEDVGGEGSGTWRIEDDLLFLRLSGETEEQPGRWQVTGETLVLTDQLDGTVLLFERR